MSPAPTPIFIARLKLTFVVAKPPPSHVFTEVALMAAEENALYRAASELTRG